MPKSIRDFTKEARKPRLHAGKYLATVTFCDFDDSYLNKSAFKVCYELENSKGDTFEFSEIFKSSSTAPRTAAFFSHLKNIGIPPDKFQDFVGVREHVTLKPNFVEGYAHAMLSIDPESRCLVEETEVES